MNPKAGTIVVDVDSTETAGDFQPIPEGVYACKIIEAKLEETKDGGWPMPTFTLEIQDGQYKGRRVWHRRPIVPPGQDGKKPTIAFVKADAAALGIALKQGLVLDLARTLVKEGFGKLVAVKVGFGRGDYADRNEVKALLPIAKLGEGYSNGETVLLDD